MAAGQPARSAEAARVWMGRTGVTAAITLIGVAVRTSAQAYQPLVRPLLDE